MFFFFFAGDLGKAVEEIERETCKDKEKEPCSGERKSTV